MPVYKVHVELIEDYDDIEADNEEEACVIVRNYMRKCCSLYTDASVDAEEIKINDKAEN